MSIATSLVNVADKVISKFGGDVTIRYITAGTYNYIFIFMIIMIPINHSYYIGNLNCLFFQRDF